MTVWRLVGDKMWLEDSIKYTFALNAKLNKMQEIGSRRRLMGDKMWLEKTQ